MRPGDRAWLTLATEIATYDATADHGELLSEAVDRYLQRRPIVTTIIATYLYLHLLNLWPDRYDPLTQLAKRVGQ